MIRISPIESQDRNYELPKTEIKDVKELPSEFNIPYPFEPKFQGPNLSCFGCMMAEWYETIYNDQYKKELEKYLFDFHGLKKEEITDEQKKFSISFAYGNRDKNLDYLGPGAIVRQQLQHCKDEGMVLAIDYETDLELPYLIDDVNNSKIYLQKNMEYFKIKDFVRLKNIDEARLFMYNNQYPIISTINMYSNFIETGKDGIVPRCDGIFQSKHGLLLNGWREDELIKGLNSYGIEWGDKGYCYLDPEDEKLFSEFWGIIPQDHMILPEDLKKLWRIQIFSSIYREEAAKVANEFRQLRLTEYQKYLLNTDQEFLDAILLKINNEFRVQVGAFTEKENAFKMLEFLENAGYNNMIVNVREPIEEIIED